MINTNVHTSLVMVFCVLSLSCSTTRPIAKTEEIIPATALKPLGRYIINDRQNLELISSAVHFGFSFEGNECRINASLPGNYGHNYLQYEIDGKYQKRIRIDGTNNQPVTITATGTGKHIVWIYKATEAHTGAIIIEKITGNNVKVLEKPAAPLIEFIGNSITCGAAADASEVPCGTGEYHDQHNAYQAYGPRVARVLNTNFLLSSVSGIGIYRNWNSDEPIMPKVYEKVDFQSDNKQLWDFKQYTPRIVSIALGTNDLSKGDGVKKRLPFDSAIFVNSYVNFVQLVKSKYPAAQIALLSSPMIGGADRILLQNCLTTIKEKIDVMSPGKKVEVFFFEPMQPHGCSSHPNVEDHVVLAKQLVPFFKKLLQ